MSPALLPSPALPKRFVLPTCRESHDGGVDCGKIGKESVYFVEHVVVGRNDVNKILDDTYIEVYSKGICGQCNPRLEYTLWQGRHDGVLFVPNTGMMAATVSRECDDCHPGVKNGRLQTESEGNSFSGLRISEVCENIGQHSEREYLRQHPRRGILVGICAFEMDDKLLMRCFYFTIDAGYCVFVFAFVRIV